MYLKQDIDALKQAIADLAQEGAGGGADTTVSGKKLAALVQLSESIRPQVISLAIHAHRFGETHLLFAGPEVVSEDRVIELLGKDYEPDREEDISIGVMDHTWGTAANTEVKERTSHGCGQDDDEAPLESLSPG
jgi:hypothetical protein